MPIRKKNLSCAECQVTERMASPHLQGKSWCKEVVQKRREGFRKCGYENRQPMDHGSPTKSDNQFVQKLS